MDNKLEKVLKQVNFLSPKTLHTRRVSESIHAAEPNVRDSPSNYKNALKGDNETI